MNTFIYFNTDKFEVRIIHKNVYYNYIMSILTSQYMYIGHTMETYISELVIIELASKHK